MKDTRYDSLKAELEEIKQIADTQTHHYKLGQEYLYRGLAKLYMWWDKASNEDGLLERVYDEYNIQYKKSTKHEIAFSPILRYLWDMDGTVNSNKIDLWNRCLNAVNTHYKNNKEYYKENAEEKIISYISASGGVSGLAGYQNKDEEDSKPQKNKISKTAQQKLTDAHLHNGKKFFANDAKPIVQLPIPNKLPLSDSGLTLGLLRKTTCGYELLSAIDDNELVNQAVVFSYKRTTEEMPNTARLITEIIRTQTLPTQIAKLADKLAEISKYKVGDDKKIRKQLRRLLYISADKTFVLSENRTACSVVTVAKPHFSIIDASEDVALSVGDRRYIEANLIHSGDLNFYTADAAQQVPATEDEAAYYKLQLENSVTKKFRFIRFYPLTVYKSVARRQANLKKDCAFTPTYTATLDAKWISDMYAQFLSKWVNGFGKSIKRREHRLLQVSLGCASVVFGFNLRAQKDYSSFEAVDYEKPLASAQSLTLQFLSKDIMSVLNALVQLEIEGDVLLEADSKMLRLSFKTDCADYIINVPCSTLKANRISDYFAEYGAADES